MQMFTGKAKRLDIFMGESDIHHHKASYMAIVEWLRANGVAGATVTRGVAGYGASSHLHTASILRLSMDLPIVVSVIDRPERIDAIIAPLAEIAPNAMMTTHEIEIVRPGVGQKKET